MMKYGQVKAYNKKTGVATIAYVRPDACAKCKACGHMNQSGTIDIKAVCEVGDWVKVVMPDRVFMRATTIAYVLPLVCFLGGLALGWTLSGQSEGWALAGSFIGLGLSLLGLWLNEKRISGKPEWSPRVEAVYKDKPQMDDLGCDGAK